MKQPTKSQLKKIRAIEAKGYSTSYSKRLIRGVMKGKTVQQSRGHRKGEAARRREYQRRENEGLTTNQIHSIRNWYWKKFDPRDFKEIPTDEDVIQFARDEGIEKFRQYQTVWNEQRRVYVKSKDNGTWESKGLPHLEFITDLAGVRPTGDSQWLYYH